jgi:AcrR family transcriptional regulator
MKVSPVAEHRTQPERSQATRGALIDAARKLFAAEGFAGTATEDVVRVAGLTRGAIYYHFKDKVDLFRATVEEVERATAEKVALAALAKDDPWDQLLEGLDVFLDACLDPEVQRISLVDAVSVLGWEGYREIDLRYGFGLLKGALLQAMDAGHLKQQRIEPLAHIVLGALLEGAMLIATSQDPVGARLDVGTTLRQLLDGIKTEPKKKTRQRRRSPHPIGSAHH